MRRTQKAVLVLASGIALASISLSDAVHADPSPQSDDAGTQAVESDMHEFMEYYFQPTYKRLKAAMAEAPADRAGWKAVKADSLILAESGNLLVARAPDGDNGNWNKHSVQVRQFGGKLYAAAKKQDFETANASYRLMIEHCNACHKEYENGKHILQP